MTAEVVKEDGCEQQGTEDQRDQYCSGSPWIADSAPAKTKEEEGQACGVEEDDADVVEFFQDFHPRSVSQGLGGRDIEDCCSDE